MAFRRTLSIRATLLARRLNPSFTYISHLDHDQTKHQDLHSSVPMIDTNLTQMRSFGSCVSNNTSWKLITGAFRRTGYGCVGSGLVLNRYISTSIAEGDTTSFPNEVPMELIIDDSASLITDAPMEAVNEVAIAAVNEVAIAAADSVFPVAAVQYLIDSVHSITGFNWWASIALATLLVRGVTLPLLIKIVKEENRFMLLQLQPMMRDTKDLLQDLLQDKVNFHAMVQFLKEYKTPSDEEFNKAMRWLNLYGACLFIPFKKTFLQLPLFISFILALYNMAEKVPSFKTGGALWFTDLTTPDAMYIFPILMALTYFKGEKTALQNSRRVFGLLLFLVFMNIPKAIFCYWLTDRLCALCWASVLKDPKVRMTLGFPETPTAAPSKIPKRKVI